MKLQWLINTNISSGIHSREWLTIRLRKENEGSSVKFRVWRTADTKPAGSNVKVLMWVQTHGGKT